MAIEPLSATLSQHLRSLNLATDAQLRSCQRHFRQLVRDLPAFDSVWIDALIQEGVLTPFQGAMLSSSPELLRRGRYVLVDRLPHDGWPVRYHARLLDGTQSAAIAELTTRGDELAKVRERLGRHLTAVQGTVHRGLCLAAEMLEVDQAVCAVSPLPTGESLDELFVRRGRFPGDVVAEIARQMFEGLARLEQAGTLHGDLRMRNVLLDAGGRLRVINSGLLAAVHPLITIHSTLPVECCFGIAPELIGGRAERTPATEMYALGCLLWHLLAGRPPHLSADPLDQLAEHQRSTIPDVRSMAPETPSALAALINRLVARHPSERFRSLTIAAVEFETSQSRGRATVAQFQASYQSMAPIRLGTLRRQPRNSTLQGALTVTVLLGAAILFIAPGVGRSLLDSAGRMLQATQADDALSTGQSQPADSLDSNEATSPGRQNHSPTSDPVTIGSVPGETPGSSSTSVAGLPHLLPLMETPEHSGVIQLDQAGPYVASGFSSVGELRVRGQSKERSVIEVVDQPLRLAGTRITLENVVVQRHSGSPNNSPLVEVNSQQLVLINCEFHADSMGESNVTDTPPHDELASIRWRHLDEKGILPGKIEVTACQFTGAGSVVRCDSVPQIIQISQSACLGTGVICDIHQAPSMRGLNVTLTESTLRQCGPLVREHRLSSQKQTPIIIELSRCVLDLQPENAVAEGCGVLPASWRPRIRIDSINSFLSSRSEYVGRRLEAGSELIPIDPSALEIEGLLPAEFEFAGPMSAYWNQNVVTSYIADAQSDELPGIMSRPVENVKRSTLPNRLGRPPVDEDRSQP